MTSQNDEPDVLREHPHADQRRWFRVVYAVTLDVLAFDEHEATLVGECAAQWPGSWSPPHEPIPVLGVINGYEARATIVRSQALLSKEQPNG